MTKSQVLTSLLCPRLLKIFLGKENNATLLPEAKTQRGGSETPGVPDVPGEEQWTSSDSFQAPLPYTTYAPSLPPHPYQCTPPPLPLLLADFSLLDLKLQQSQDYWATCTVESDGVCDPFQVLNSVFFCLGCPHHKGVLLEHFKKYSWGSSSVVRH